MSKPRYRLAFDQPLHAGQTLVLRDKSHHYLRHVLRLGEGDCVALFHPSSGEWLARLALVQKKEITLRLEQQLRIAEAQHFHLTVCVAPIKSGRLETIWEKACELGAAVVQPVITERTIVDRVNLERADAIMREAAEQCERLSWPEMRPAISLQQLLGEWPRDVPLLYGDERGASASVTGLMSEPPPPRWGILTGPEGGFSPAEFAALAHCKPARGLSLGPRILRADTAMISLTTASLMAWGDWQSTPHPTESSL
jgi:16S rRNA (uracil1498-N3)-methyltransferase